MPGQRFRLAGQQVSGAPVVSQPDRFRSGRIQGLADQIVGKLEVTARVPPSNRACSASSH